MSTRVLLWSPHGAGEHYHGPGAFAYRLYNSAPAESVTVELAHASAAQSVYPLFAGQHRIAQPPAGAARLATFLLRSDRWLARNAGRFDVMHCLAGFHTTVRPAHRAQRLGLPCVLFVANHRLEFVDKPGLRGWFNLAGKRRRMIRELSAVIAMSRAIYEELLEIGVEPRRIARIPMAVDTQRFRPAQDAAERAALRRELGFLDMPSLIFVGSITERKRPHLLIEAIGRLRAAGTDCQLILAGPEHEPAYSASMRALAESHHVESLIRWTGHVRQIETLLRAADVFALPSSKEGMPAALAEAMAAGLPPIATRISGCEDLIEHGSNGFLVEPDGAEIARMLESYLRDPRLTSEHGARARARVVETCSSERVVNAHLALFMAVTQGRDPAAASTLS